MSLMGGFLVLLGVIGLACSLTAQYFAAKAATGAATALRNDLFTHISGLSYKEIDQVGSICPDYPHDQRYQSGTERHQYDSAPASAVSVCSVWSHGNGLYGRPEGGHGFAVTIPLLCIVVFGIMLISMPLYQAVQKSWTGY